MNMKTLQIYLENSYCKEIDASVVEIVSENENEQVIILDQTIFYPMGGGQPTDQGNVRIDNQGYELYQCMIVNGEIHHFVKKSSFKIGDKVQLELNWDRRYKNMKTHTAGHVVDFAMFRLGFSPNILSPIKGDHGKKPFIVYSGISDQVTSEKIQDEVNKLISESINITCEYMDIEILKTKAIYLQPNLPSNKKLRALTFQGIDTVADGGTQLKNTNELERVVITNVEANKESNQTIVGYSI